MQEFKQIYKILNILKASLDVEEFDKDLLSSQSLGLSEARWARIMALLLNNGYITGVEVWNAFNVSYPRVCIVRPEITLKGLEYLEENSLMKKAKEIAKGLINVIN